MGISIRAYARHRGVSDAAVRKAIAAGRITPEADGTIDAERVDREWARNTDPDQQARGAPEQFEVTQQRVQASAQRPPAAERDDSNPMLLEVKARSERARAELLEMEIMEKRGELVVADQVRRVQFNLARSTRNALLALPARLSPLLAPVTDAAEIERLLEAEIRKICQQIASTPGTEQ